jgi:hypothetical protein
MVSKGSASIPGNNVDKVIDFLNDLKSEGSRKLKSDTNLVIETIKAGYFLCGLGVSVE